MTLEPSITETNPEDAQTLSDILSEALPGEGDSLNPPADPEPGEGGQPEVAAEPKPGEGKPEDGGEPQPAPEAAPKLAAAEPKTYEYKGKQYTLEQMVELGILDDVVQTARQFPTIQTKYQSLLEEKIVTPAPGDAAAQQPQGPTGDQILQAYTPVMQDMANNGYIEPEAYEVFPKLVSALMFHRDLLYDVRNTVMAMVQNASATQETSQRGAALNYVNGICDKVAGEEEHFALLRDTEARKGFYEYLGTLNYPIDKIDDEFVRKQWLAYNSGPMLEAVRLAAGGQKATDSKIRRNAKGEGSGVRPAPAKVEPKTADAELIASFME